MAGLQTGQYDATTGVPYDSYDMFANDDNFIVKESFSQIPMLIFNKKEGLGANQTIRQAIAAH